MRYLVACVIVASLVHPAVATAATPSPQKLDGFSLRDYRGKVHDLKDYADKKLVVIAVLGTECPLAKLYGQRLGKLAKEYESKGVAFLGLDSNRQDSLTEIAAYARQHEISFPVLKDQGQEVADALGAVRTPEVFLLDADRVVRYAGRVDDQYGIGVVRPAPTRRDLAAAIDELLAGKPVSVASTPPVGCFIGRDPKPQQASTSADVTYSNQIARLLEKRCVECHRSGEIAPFPLTSYDEVVGWAPTIREVVNDGRMPPWFADPAHGKFANDARLTSDEKQLVRDWIDAGCPEGQRSLLPEPRKFTTGWQIPEPDQVIYIRDTPFKVQAEGEVKYQYFLVDPGFKEDKWIQYAEARPGNRAVVHHIVTAFRKPGEKGAGVGDATGGLVGYAPGMPPCRYPEGTALFVPAGSQLIFQLHYTPNGSPQEDRSYVGLVFADPATVKRRIYGGKALARGFEIPPGADSHEVQAQYTVPFDATLFTLTPHMHMRGKSFRYEAQYPDGTKEILLDIPRWDFNWQLRYDLAEPISLPKGTKLTATAHYDNSEHNLSNPDPKATVRWGDQTWDEMMIGYFTGVPAEESKELPPRAIGSRLRDVLQQYLKNQKQP